MKIWKQGGTIVYALNPSIIGTTLPPDAPLESAWQGTVSARFEDLTDEENAPEAALGLPLLEIYSPIREVWSGDVIAVAEFYAVETTLANDLAAARRQSWLIVAAVFGVCGLALFGIVRAGGQTIARQQARLRDEAERSRAIARQNVELRQRAVGAAARAAAQTERTLRQVGADLHDGPSQYLALAALRLERVLPDTEAGREEAEGIRGRPQHRARRDPQHLPRPVAARPRPPAASARWPGVPSRPTSATPRAPSPCATTARTIRA